jgi:imidazolonepropionase-like amidohydrolase
MPLSPAFVKPWLPKTEHPSILFTGAQLVDPVDGQVHPNASVHINQGIIRAVSLNGEPIETPGNTVNVNLGGQYLCPGLIDAHVHISAVPGEMDFRHIMAMPESEALLRMTYVCRDMLYRGFTSVRDCGGAPGALKQSCSEWLVPGPRLFISGHALSQTGGHGDFRHQHDHSHCSSSFVSGLGRVCDGVAACIAVARDELRRGADFIKIMGSGGVVSPTDKLENHQFCPEEIQAMVMVANNAHTYVTCHAYSPQSIRIAIDNGVRGIEHGNLIDRDTALLMAEKDCYLTPTLVTFFSMGDPAVAHFLPPDSRTKNVDVMNMGLDALRIAKECNVTMCYGSDLLGPLGKYQNREFGLRSQVLSALDILQSATINPAKMMGQPQLGQIKPGFFADLLIIKNNPLDDITVFDRSDEEIQLVMKEGRVCRSSIEALPGLLDEIMHF